MPASWLKTVFLGVILFCKICSADTLHQAILDFSHVNLTIDEGSYDWSHQTIWQIGFIGIDTSFTSAAGWDLI